MRRYDDLHLVVTGSRNADEKDGERIMLTLDAIERRNKGRRIVVHHGGAKGADSYAAKWASQGIRREEAPHLADWSRHGRAAGPIRNKEMLRSAKHEIVLAFPKGESKGTRGAMREAKRLGLKVHDGSVSKSDDPDGEPGSRTGARARMRTRSMRLPDGSKVRLNANNSAVRLHRFPRPRYMYEHRGKVRDVRLPKENMVEARRKGKQIGYLALNRGGDDANEPRMVEVLPEYRRQGVGRAMWRRAQAVGFEPQHSSDEHLNEYSRPWSKVVKGGSAEAEAMRAAFQARAESSRWNQQHPDLLARHDVISSRTAGERRAALIAGRKRVGDRSMTRPIRDDEGLVPLHGRDRRNWLRRYRRQQAISKRVPVASTQWNDPDYDSHKQRRIPIRSADVDVDHRIADTIKYLNDAGAWTNYSCQGSSKRVDGHGKGYIAFHHRVSEEKAAAEMKRLGITAKRKHIYDPKTAKGNWLSGSGEAPDDAVVVERPMSFRHGTKMVRHGPVYRFPVGMRAGMNSRARALNKGSERGGVRKSYGYSGPMTSLAELGEISKAQSNPDAALMYGGGAAAGAGALSGAYALRANARASHIKRGGKSIKTDIARTGNTRAAAATAASNANWQALRFKAKADRLESKKPLLSRSGKISGHRAQQGAFEQETLKHQGLANTAQAEQDAFKAAYHKKIRPAAAFKMRRNIAGGAGGALAIGGAGAIAVAMQRRRAGMTSDQAPPPQG